MEKRRTYCSGPRFVKPSGAPPTFQTIRRIIDRLHAKFGPGYRFAPEAILEGGIQWMTWPRKPAGITQFKTMRICFDNWPTLREESREPCDPDHSTRPLVFRGYSDTSRVVTFLKAFDGAPLWTLEEVEKFTCAIEEEFGTRRIKRDMPRAKDLSID